jgi:hypothetical protein
LFVWAYNRPDPTKVLTAIDELLFQADSLRASDEGTSGDAGCCAKSEYFWREAAFGNVELIPRAGWDRLNGGRTLGPAPPSSGLRVLFLLFSYLSYFSGECERLVTGLSPELMIQKR